MLQRGNLFSQTKHDRMWNPKGTKSYSKIRSLRFIDDMITYEVALLTNPTSKAILYVWRCLSVFLPIRHSSINHFSFKNFLQYLKKIIRKLMNLRDCLFSNIKSVKEINLK